MDEEYSEIDISEQIDNSWNKDTALAIKKKGEYYSVKIRTKDKNDLKAKYIIDTSKINNKKELRTAIRNNRRVVMITYCFILYHLLNLSGNLSKKVKLCNDVSPKKYIFFYLDKICSKNKFPPLTQRIKIKFREDGDSKSQAHYIAKKVAKGREKANLTLKKQHLDRLKYLIRILLEEID